MPSVEQEPQWDPEPHGGRVSLSLGAGVPAGSAGGQVSPWGNRLVRQVCTLPCLPEAKPTPCGRSGHAATFLQTSPRLLLQPAGAGKGSSPRPSAEPAEIQGVGGTPPQPSGIGGFRAEGR